MADSMVEGMVEDTVQCMVEDRFGDTSVNTVEYKADNMTAEGNIEVENCCQAVVEDKL